MKIMKVKISRELVGSMFELGYKHDEFVCIRGLPKGIVLCGTELTPDFLILAFTHPDFDDLLEGESIPEFVPNYQNTQYQYIKTCQ